MNRKRALIASGAVFVAVAGGVLASLGVMGIPGLGGSAAEGVPDPSDRVAAGEHLYREVMSRHPLLLDKSSFEPGATDAGGEVNSMRLPQQEWSRLEQPQKNSLALYLESMGETWRIEVGQLSRDGQRIHGLRAVMTSAQWRELVK